MYILPLIGLGSPLNLIVDPYSDAAITPCYYASTQKRGGWLQTNQPEQKSDDRPGDVCYQ